MVAPIPKVLLIHEVEYSDFTSGRYGDDYEEPQTVKYVRLDAKSKRISSSQGQDFISQTTMYWDATYSTPCIFRKEGKVKFGDIVMYVKEVSLFYDEGKLHHLELSLE